MLPHVAVLSCLVVALLALVAPAQLLAIPPDNLGGTLGIYILNIRILINIKITLPWPSCRGSASPPRRTRCPVACLWGLLEDF